MIYYPLTTNTIDNEDKKLAIEVIKSGNITRGYYNKSVEKYFSKKFNRYALLVNSGSSANLLSVFAACNPLRNISFKRGDEAIIQGLCWSTSLWPLVQAGLKINFVDVDINTFNVKTKDILNSITNKILVSHLAQNTKRNF